MKGLAGNKNIIHCHLLKKIVRLEKVEKRHFYPLNFLLYVFILVNRTCQKTLLTEVVDIYRNYIEGR